MSEVRIPEVERVIRKYDEEPSYDHVTIETMESGGSARFGCIIFDFLGGGKLRIDHSLARRIHALVGDNVKGESDEAD